MTEVDLQNTQEKFFKVLDTRLEQHAENRVNYVLQEGAAVVSYQNLLSTSHSNQNTNFQLNNIASTVARGSKMNIGLNVVVSMTFNNTGTTTAQPIGSDNFGWKSFPCNRIIANIQHQINSANYTLNSNEIIDSVSRLNNYSEDANFNYNTQVDNYDSYAYATGTQINVLSPYSNTIVGEGVNKPRSGNITSITGNSVPAGSSATVTVNATFYEPLWTVFNNVSKKDSRSFFGINGEKISIQYVSDLFNNLVALGALPLNVSLTSWNVSLGTNANLYVEYITPKQDVMKSLPYTSVYPYSDYQIFSTKVGSNVVQNGILSSVSSQVIQFTGLPEKVLIYVRDSNNNRTAQKADNYLKVNNIQISFDNGLQLFQGAIDEKLYEVSTRNGLVQPRQSFMAQQLNLNNVVNGQLFGNGSVMVFSPSLDFSIREEDASGSPGRYQMQIQSSNWVNKSTITMVEPTLYIIGISSAVLKREGTNYYNNNLVLPEGVIEDAKELPAVSTDEFNEAGHDFQMGGGIGSFVKKLYHSGVRSYDFVKKHRGDIENAYHKGKDVYSHLKGVRGSNPLGGAVLGGRLYNSKKNMNLYYK
jgi:hypothetical protein